MRQNLHTVAQEISDNPVITSLRNADRPPEAFTFDSYVYHWANLVEEIATRAKPNPKELNATLSLSHAAKKDENFTTTDHYLYSIQKAMQSKHGATVLQNQIEHAYERIDQHMRNHIDSWVEGAQEFRDICQQVYDRLPQQEQTSRRDLLELVKSSTDCITDVPRSSVDNALQSWRTETQSRREAL